MLFLHSTTTTTTLLLYPSLSPPSSGPEEGSDQPESLNKPKSRQGRAELTHTRSHTLVQLLSAEEICWAESEAEVGLLQLLREDYLTVVFNGTYET